VTEGVVMVSRINDFHGLYFEPKGPTIVLVYRDRPGVLGQIGSALAKRGINIDDVRNPHDSRGEKSVAILKVNRTVAEEDLRAIAAEIEATTAFCIDL
jgi:D-3-phosphoglycerate dehydrogenase